MHLVWMGKERDAKRKIVDNLDTIGYNYFHMTEIARPTQPHPSELQQTYQYGSPIARGLAVVAKAFLPSVLTNSHVETGDANKNAEQHKFAKWAAAGEVGALTALAYGNPAGLFIYGLLRVGSLWSEHDARKAAGIIEKGPEIHFPKLNLKKVK